MHIRAGELAVNAPRDVIVRLAAGHERLHTELGAAEALHGVSEDVAEGMLALGDVCERRVALACLDRGLMVSSRRLLNVRGMRVFGPHAVSTETAARVFGLAGAPVGRSGGRRGVGRRHRDPEPQPQEGGRAGTQTSV